MAHSINRRALAWLRGQLPELVAGGVISAENAAALDRHYAKAESGGANFGFIVLAIVGSALIGAGVILLVAHNWDDLSRPVRCLLAFLPLVVAQGLALFVLARRNDSTPWRESISIFDMAAVAASIALVSQIYQIQGSFADFMRVWLLLSIPVVYIFRSNFGALACIVGTAIFAMSGSWKQPAGMFFWVLFLLLMPFYAGVIRKTRAGWTFWALSLALIAAAAIGLGMTADLADCDVGPVAFAGFFATVYLAGMMWPEDGSESLNVLSIVGGLGIAATAVVLTFEEMWHLRDASSWSGLGPAQGIAIGICFGFVAVAIAMAGWAFQRGKVLYSLSAACLPIVAVLARIVSGLAPQLDRSNSNHYTFLAALLLNVYALVLGIELLARGIRAGSIARANFGLLVVAALAFARFFDSDLSFVARGVGFIAVGVGFLVANVIFFRKRTHS